MSHPRTKGGTRYESGRDAGREWGGDGKRGRDGERGWDGESKRGWARVRGTASAIACRVPGRRDDDNVTIPNEG